MSYFCPIHNKQYETIDAFKAHCLKAKDQKHINLIYNETNPEDWVQCKVDGCTFKASRIDLHLKKVHNLDKEEYERQFSSDVFSKSFIDNTMKSANSAHDSYDISGENNPFYGKKHSKKTKKMMSNSIKNFWEKKNDINK